MKYLFFILAAGLAPTAQPVRADDPAVPGAGFPTLRYEALWTKSPFAVATPEAGPDSPDYSLVGYAVNINGISYASLIEKQNNEHFLISTEKPVRGLTLTSITHNPNSSDTYAVMQKDGQTITLKLEQAPVATTAPGLNGQNVNPVSMPPGMMTPQIIMPGASSGGNPVFPELNRPFPARFRRTLINLPPQPGQQQPGQQQPVQVHSVPPPPP
jgi:hypothetical protein